MFLWINEMMWRYDSSDKARVVKKVSDVLSYYLKICPSFKYKNFSFDKKGTFGHLLLGRASKKSRPLTPFLDLTRATGVLSSFQ